MSTPGKSATDLAKRFVLLMRVGVRMSHCSGCNLVPSLMVHPLGSSSGMVSSTSSRQVSRPTLGSRSSPEGYVRAGWSFNMIGLKDGKLRA